jgi:hypothetical protein
LFLRISAVLAVGAARRLKSRTEPLISERQTEVAHA